MDKKDSERKQRMIVTLSLFGREVCCYTLKTRYSCTVQDKYKTSIYIFICLYKQTKCSLNTHINKS